MDSRGFATGTFVGSRPQYLKSTVPQQHSPEHRDGTRPPGVESERGPLRRLATRPTLGGCFYSVASRRRLACRDGLPRLLVDKTAFSDYEAMCQSALCTGQEVACSFGSAESKPRPVLAELPCRDSAFQVAHVYFWELNALLPIDSNGDPKSHDPLASGPKPGQRTGSES